jgi:hypothetical protein
VFVNKVYTDSHVRTLNPGNFLIMQVNFYNSKEDVTLESIKYHLKEPMFNMNCSLSLMVKRSDLLSIRLLFKSKVTSKLRILLLKLKKRRTRNQRRKRRRRKTLLTSRRKNLKLKLLKSLKNRPLKKNRNKNDYIYSNVY